MCAGAPTPRCTKALNWPCCSSRRARRACVQKVAEAEALAAGGVLDITITNQVVAMPKLHRVARLAAQLAARGGRLGVAVDHPEGIERLAEAMVQHGSDAGIDVLVEIDVGQGRCGVPPGEAAVPLALAVSRSPRLRFAGLQAYHGRAQHLGSSVGRREAIAQVVRAANHTRQLIEAEGLTVPLITGSGTGTLVHEAASGVFGELQAGSFMFMDADYARNEREPAQPTFEHALYVKTQVVSVRDTHAVCDAGHKSHAIDSGLPTVALLPPGMRCATPTAATNMACCMPTAPRPACPRSAACSGSSPATATRR